MITKPMSRHFGVFPMLKQSTAWLSAAIMTGLVTSQANAAIDVTGALANMDDGQAALESLGEKAIAVAVVAFALFFVFRRVPKG